jgi:hypothetical protein
MAACGIDSLVFKDGVAYDSKRLLESVRGRYGQ